MIIEITLRGNRPMLMHNIRLANPLDPYTQHLKSFTSKRKKTDEDLAQISYWEARGGVYETPEGFLGFPSDNVWRAMYDAATAFKMGANLKRALLPLTDIEPLLVADEKRTVEDHLSREGGIDVRAVRNQSSRVMRSRPRIEPPWTITHQFDLLTDIVDVEELTPVINRAGRVVGVGDYRPRFGTFTGTISEVAQ